MPRQKEILNSKSLERTIERMSQQILEDFQEQSVMLMGMATRGIPISERIAKYLKAKGVQVTTGALDTTFYRDDYHFRKKLKNPSIHVTSIPESQVDHLNIILVDDVLYTGRSIRSALSAIMDLGRPESIHLAVLVDRGGREMPIEAKYVGTHCPTEENEEIKVNLSEIDSDDSAWIVPVSEEN